jgi:adenylate cyclase
MRTRRLFSYPLSLAVVVAALIAFTGGWIAWWNYRAGLANIRSLAAGLFDQVARQAAAGTEAFLLRAPPAAATLAELAALDPLDVTTEALARRFVAALRANAGFSWVSYSDETGAFTGAFRTKAGSIRVNRSSIAFGKTVLEEHDVAADGSWHPARRELDTGYDPRARPFYRLAARARRGVWTPPYVFEGQNVPGITYARPIYSGAPGAAASAAGGALRGVLTIDFDLARLSELARELRFSPHGRVVVLTADDIVLAHPTAPVVAATAGKPALVPAARIADPAVRALLARRGATELAINDTPHLARWLPIRIDETAAWHVLAFAPEADFTAGLRGRVVSSLLISLVAVIVAVVIAWVLARRVSKPLVGLAGEMAKVGEFRIEDAADPPPSLFREIDMMNTALVRMKSGLASFARYVPRDLVRAVVASGQPAELAGDTRTLTIYFSDLAGFTSLAESRTPDELVKLLGEYFDGMSQIIAAEQGTLDKYLGDGIMAFWGAPLPLAEHAARACAAALRCHRHVQKLAIRGVSLTTRIGIATGDVLVGNIGSTERLNYTVMGDTANLASRLEGLNKQYGTQLMISESTFEEARGAIVARPLDVVAVKGKVRGVRVYELLALASEADADAEALAADGAAALDAYLARRFDEAVAAWDRVLARRPGDRAATILRARAAALAATPPGPEWTGVTVATEK